MLRLRGIQTLVQRRWATVPFAAFSTSSEGVVDEMIAYARSNYKVIWG